MKTILIDFSEVEEMNGNYTTLWKGKVKINDKSISINGCNDRGCTFTERISDEVCEQYDFSENLEDSIIEAIDSAVIGSVYNLIIDDDNDNAKIEEHENFNNRYLVTDCMNNTVAVFMLLEEAQKTCKNHTIKKINVENIHDYL